MISGLLTDNLRNISVDQDVSSFRVISTRRFTPEEIQWAKDKGLKRFYFPSLSLSDSQEFFAEFDRFWNQLIGPFDPSHPFWRNVISSKMQEWERSVGYLTVILFTLSRLPVKENIKLLIVYSSIEERDIFVGFAQKFGWNIVSNKKESRGGVKKKISRNPKLYFFLPENFGLFIQKIPNSLSKSRYKKFFKN